MATYGRNTSARVSDYMYNQSYYARLPPPNDDQAVPLLNSVNTYQRVRVVIG